MSDLLARLQSTRIEDRAARPPRPPDRPAGVSGRDIAGHRASHPGWDFGNPVIHVDEQYYLLVGDRMLHGALPYVDIWDRKPLGLFLIFAAIRLLAGDGIMQYQIVATLFAAATALLIARIGAHRPRLSRGGAGTPI